MKLHPDLETLLEIQDLRALSRDIATPQPGAAYRDAGAEQAARRQERIAEREPRLRPAVRSEHLPLAQRHEVAVAPVLDGICRGCFVQVPASREHDAGRHGEIRTCDSCGRFLYYTD